MAEIDDGGPGRGIRTLEEPLVEECPRCVDWQRLGLSSHCPSCEDALNAEIRRETQEKETGE